MRSFSTSGFSGVYAYLSTLLPCFVVIGVANVLQEKQEDDRCYNFTVGGFQEFYSPNYPNTYPKNIKCQRVITAPVGMVVKVDFLDKFDVEPSENCKHDKLEVRDGRHGFDPLFYNTSWCGHKFPELIQSTQRYLWLRFITDDTIEYTGFKAVYQFKPRIGAHTLPAINCTFSLTTTEGIISSDMIPADILTQAAAMQGVDCIWSIEVKEGWFISVNFLGFELAVPNTCAKNKVEIYANQLEDVNRKERYCGTSAKNTTYKEHHLFVRLKANTDALKSQFRMHYTAIRQISADASCDEVTEFDCKDMSCIDISLRCNGNKNCKYNTDEEECTVQEQEVFLLKQNVMGILTIGMVLLLSIWISMVVSCYREWKQLKERENELATRRSMPGGLNRITVMGGGGGGTTDDHGCYVPEVDLSVFHIKRFNGGMPFEHRDRDSARSNSSTPPPPPPPTHAARTSTLKTYLDEEETGPVADDRPRSFESTTSAPDVIGRH